MVLLNTKLNTLLFMAFLRIYEEIQKIEANEFQYQEQVMSNHLKSFTV